MSNFAVMTHWVITQASWLLWRSCSPTNRPQWRTSRRRSRHSVFCTVTTLSNTEVSATAQVIRGLTEFQTGGRGLAPTQEKTFFRNKNDEKKRRMITEGCLGVRLKWAKEILSRMGCLPWMQGASLWVWWWSTCPTAAWLATWRRTNIKSTHNDCCCLLLRFVR